MEVMEEQSGGENIKTLELTVQLYIRNLRSNRSKGAGEYTPADGADEGPCCCCYQHLFLLV